MKSRNRQGSVRRAALAQDDRVRGRTSVPPAQRTRRHERIGRGIITRAQTTAPASEAPRFSERRWRFLRDLGVSSYLLRPSPPVAPTFGTTLSASPRARRPIGHPAIDAPAFSAQGERPPRPLALRSLRRRASWSSASPGTTSRPSSTRSATSPSSPCRTATRLHAGQLGMDCRYCHNHVEQSAARQRPVDADVHELPQRRSGPSRPSCCRSARAGPPASPIEWVQGAPPAGLRALHARGPRQRGRGVRELPRPRSTRWRSSHQVEPLSMGWCLECHRAARAAPPRPRRS